MRNRRYKYTALIVVVLLVFTITTPAAVVWVDDDLEPHFGRPSTSSRPDLTATGRQEPKDAPRQETIPTSLRPAIARQHAATPSAGSDPALKRINQISEVNLDQLRRIAGFERLGADLDDVMAIIVRR